MTAQCYLIMYYLVVQYALIFVTNYYHWVHESYYYILHTVHRFIVYQMSKVSVARVKFKRSGMLKCLEGDLTNYSKTHVNINMYLHSYLERTEK
jgi:hypothetical protein